MLESIPAWYFRAFSGSLNIQNVKNIKNKEGLPDLELLFGIEQIAKYCSKHYLPILKSEMKLLRERGFIDPQWDSNIKDVLNHISDKLIEGKVFLLRVGRHSGAESVTINGKRQIKIMKGQPEYQSQTKTLWLGASEPKQRENLIPFGWLLVEIHPSAKSVCDWQEMSEFCLKQQSVFRKWMKKHTEEKNKLNARRLLIEKRSQQEEIKLKLRLEAEKKAEQQRLEKQRLQEQKEQERLASLSPLEQELEAFLQAIQPAEHDTRLLQELEKDRWQGDDAKIVATKIKSLMEESGKWMPDFTGTNKQKVKLKDRSLKVQAYLT